MNIGEVGKWCLRHFLLLWAGLFLIASLCGFLFLEPSKMDRLSQPFILIIYITSALFFFVYDALQALGVSEHRNILAITFSFIVFAILVALDFAINRFLRRGAKDVDANVPVRPAPKLGRLLLRHAILVWGILQFLAGGAVVALDLQYDAGGLETLTFFFFWFLGQPTLIGQWLLQNLGAEFATTTWPYASLIAGLILCLVADLLVNVLFKRARAQSVSSSADVQ